MPWRPAKLPDAEYGVKFYGEPFQPNKWFIRKDGTPLRFWGEKQAQIKADALNRQEKTGQNPLGSGR